MAKGLVQITRFKRDEFVEMIRGMDRRKSEGIFEPQLPLMRLSKYVDQSVTARAKDAIPDCLTCGVCCAYLLIVPVQRTDTPGLEEYWDITSDGEAEDVVIERVLPRNLEDVGCKHLGGELGRSVSCDIYEHRPVACRVFEAGSDRCHEYRRIYGIESRLNGAELETELAHILPPSSGIIRLVRIELDSVKRTVSFDPDGNVESETNCMMRIYGFLDENADHAHDLHCYNASEETWFESDFLGMTLDEAKRMIEHAQVISN